MNHAVGNLLRHCYPYYSATAASILYRNVCLRVVDQPKKVRGSHANCTEKIAGYFSVVAVIRIDARCSASSVAHGKRTRIEEDYSFPSSGREGKY